MPFDSTVVQRRSSSCGWCPPDASPADRHVARQARGRQLAAERLQRQQQHALEDAEADILGVTAPSWHQRAAKRMLRDFEHNGIDEDLEQLRGTWSNQFGARPGLPAGPAPRPFRPTRLSGATSSSMSPCRALMLFDDSDDDEPKGPSLAEQGEVAKSRLQTLDNLRKAAAGQPLSMDITNSIRPSPGFSTSSPWRQSSRDELFKEERPRRSPAALTNNSNGSRSPFQSRVSDQPSNADPWEDWERRWAHEFRQFEEVGRAHRAAQQAEAEMRAEAERLEAEAIWRRKVAEAKRQSAQQAGKKREPTSSSSSRFPSDGPYNAGSKFSSSSSTNHSESQSNKQGQSQGRNWLPPRPPPAPPPKKTSNDPQFSSFAEFDKAWSSFEQKASSGSVRVTDIPWPTSLPSVSGISDSDSAADKKKKLRGALVRWHPDKWGRIIESVAKDEQPLVMERVKEVTQRILDEKKRHGS